MTDNIVYFDGVCGLCNSAVDFFIKRDKKRQLLFTPLQGETASKRFNFSATETFDTIIFEQKGVLYYRSGAALKMLYTIGGFWSVAVVFFIFPKFIRNTVYDFISKNRYRWFGKKETCRIPTKEERTRFLP